MWVVIMVTILFSEPLSFWDAGWNIYTWNATMAVTGFKIIQMGVKQDLLRGVTVQVGMGPWGFLYYFIYFCMFFISSIVKDFKESIKLVLLKGLGFIFSYFDLTAPMAGKNETKWVGSYLSGWHGPVLSTWVDCIKNQQIFVLFAPLITVLQICPQELIPNVGKLHEP